jgi:hypothetical protein
MGIFPDGQSICRLSERRTACGSYFDKADARLAARAALAVTEGK